MRCAIILAAVAALVCQSADSADAQRRRRGKKARSAKSKKKPAPAPSPSPSPSPSPDTGDGAATTAEPPPDGAKLKSKSRVIGKTRKGEKEKLFDFTGFEMSASTRMPQLMYFLDRANQELERASLQRRSFLPEMVRTLQEEPL